MAISFGRNWLRRGLVVVAAGLFGLGLLSVPASATKQADPTTPVVHLTRVDATTPGVQAACPITAFGYPGQVMCGTDVLYVEWNQVGWVEVFIIAPNRTIWHVWPNSGGWYHMPGDGRADNMWLAYRPANGDRIVEVWVNGVGVFCTKDPIGGSTAFNGWRRPPC